MSDIMFECFEVKETVTRNGINTSWTHIGFVKAHKDGLGGSVILKKIPRDGRFVFRQPRRSAAQHDQTIESAPDVVELKPGHKVTAKYDVLRGGKS